MAGWKSRIRAALKKRCGENRLLAKCAAEVLYLRLLRRGDLPGNNMLETIDAVVPKEKQADRRRMRKLKRDMLFSRLYYRTSNTDYFIFAFEDKSDCGRKKYVCRYELDDLQRRLNPPGKREILDKKDQTYEVFRAFYHRELLLLRDASQKDAFLRFAERHKMFLIKPQNSLGGKGIEKISLSNVQEAEAFFESRQRQLPFLLEEPIEQDPAMAKYHPQSVNTIRYNTFFHDGKMTGVLAAIRMGRGGSFVDNATSGGIYAPIDLETGIICGPAKSETCECFLFHPTTGEQIIGSRIPRWDELPPILEQLVRVEPELKQVGWDFALTRDGWVLVEANSNSAIQGFDHDHGLREQLAALFGQVTPVRRF